MNLKKLGNSDLFIGPLTFGGNVLGWTLDEAQSLRILDEFIDAGFNSIDTADTYSIWKKGNVGGESETIIGKWLKRSGNRDKIILATKFGGELTSPDLKGLSASYMVKAVDASLSRLQTDYIDLYQAHYDDLSVPQEETLKAFDQLIQQGKVRFIGASNLSAERIENSLEISKREGLAAYISLQPLYNLYDRSLFETQYLSLAKKHNLGVLPYYSLASGFLSGKYRNEHDFSKSVRGKGMKKYLNPRGNRILQALDKVAHSHKVSLASVALCWLMHQPTVTSPIVSATNSEQLKGIIQASTLALEEQELEALTMASEEGETA